MPLRALALVGPPWKDPRETGEVPVGTDGVFGRDEQHVLDLAFIIPAHFPFPKSQLCFWSLLSHRMRAGVRPQPSTDRTLRRPRY